MSLEVLSTHSYPIGLFSSQYQNFLPLTLIENDIIITTNWLVKPEDWGFPSELVYKAYDDYESVSLKKIKTRRNKITVTFISSPGGEEELSFLLRVIAIMNKLPSINRNILCNEKHIGYLKEVINDGIRLVAKEACTELETDIVLCFGSGTIHFLKSELPVIIIGPYGLGGYINPMNFQQLLGKGFMGRLGGVYGEEIPIDLLSEEIIEVKHNKELSSEAKILKSEIQKLGFLDYRTMHKQVMNRQVNGILNNVKQRWQLNMKLASNIRIVQKGRIVYLIRESIHDVIASFTEDEAPFFQYLIDKRTAKDVFQIARISIREFWDMIALLWNKKIIILYV